MAWMNQLKRQLQRFLVARQRARAIRETAAALQSLNDRMLDDIGVARNRIDDHARRSTAREERLREADDLRADTGLSGRGEEGPATRVLPGAAERVSRRGKIEVERPAATVGPGAGRHVAHSRETRVVPSWIFPRTRLVHPDQDTASRHVVAAARGQGEASARSDFARQATASRGGGELPEPALDAPEGRPHRPASIRRLER